MKKVMTAVLALVLMVSVMGCGKKQEAPAPAAAPAEQAAPAAAPADQAPAAPAEAPAAPAPAK